MPLSTFSETLPAARKAGYAIGSFSAWDVYSARTVIETAQAHRSPVIISMWQPELDLAGEEQLWVLCRSFAANATVPVVVFIDHAKTLDDVERSIGYGATSVMIDGSHLGLEENIDLTAAAAEVAHGAGVSVEGELGILGQEGGSDPDEALYTRVEDAAKFVRETGVNALAVSIGNAHGFYNGEPRLDFGRLAAIRDAVDVPLALHGGSGIPDHDLRRSIGLGIAKVNIGAEGRLAFFTGLRQSLEALGEDEVFPHVIYPRALDMHGRAVREKMEVLMSAGKAG